MTGVVATKHASRSNGSELFGSAVHVTRGEGLLRMENVPYYGDNLDILRRYVEDESVDLIYLDPPFKSNQNYNVLFKERDGSRAASQIRAFEDTCTWNQEDEAVYADRCHPKQRGGRQTQ